MNILKYISDLFNRKPKYSFGAVLNEPDVRDIPVSAFQPTLASLPDSFITDISHIDVKNQLNHGSCVAQAEGSIIEYYDHKETGILPRVAPRYLYSLAKKIDGYDGQGTYPRVVNSITVKKGCATTKTVNDDNSLSYNSYITLDETDEIIEDAYPRKSGGYAFVVPNDESLKQALVKNNLVSITLPINSIWDSKTGKINKPNDTPVQVYHRVVLYGYEIVDGDTKFLILNSWGKEWGLSGKGYFMYKDYEGKIYDPLVYVDIPNKILEKYKSMWPYKYFKPNEVVGLKPEIIKVIDKARGIAGTPFNLTSGLRSVEKNKQVGGQPNSSHLRGLAVDILCTDNTKRSKILHGLLTCGTPLFIEVAPGHIHADIDSSIHSMGQVMLLNND